MFRHAAAIIEAKGWRRGVAQLLKEGDRGTVAVTFILSLPVLMTMVGIFVQYALITNARLAVQRAAAAAARSAMTSFPTDPVLEPIDGPWNAARSACLVVEPLSPQSPLQVSQAQTVADALVNSGYALPYGFVARYAYAMSATNLQFAFENDVFSVGSSAQYMPAFARRADSHGTVTVNYEFQLTVPFAAFLIGHVGNVGGINGRFLTLTSSADVELSPGREAASDAGGNPQ